MQNVTNPVSLQFTYFMQDIPLLLDSKKTKKQMYHKEKHRVLLDASNGFGVTVAHLKYLGCF